MKLLFFYTFTSLNMLIYKQIYPFDKLLQKYELQKSLSHIIDNYDESNRPKRARSMTSVIFGTPVRARLSRELSNLTLSTFAVSYSPATENNSLQQEKDKEGEKEEKAGPSFIPHDTLTEDEIQNIDRLAQHIGKKWDAASKNVTYAHIVFNEKRLSFEQQHHYRMQLLIMALHTFYKYKEAMIPAHSMHHHVRIMTSLLLSAHISDALSSAIKQSVKQSTKNYAKLKKLTVKIYGGAPIIIDSLHMLEIKPITQPIDIPK